MEPFKKLVGKWNYNISCWFKKFLFIMNIFHEVFKKLLVCL